MTLRHLAGVVGVCGAVGLAVSGSLLPLVLAAATSGVVGFAGADRRAAAAARAERVRVETLVVDLEVAVHAGAALPAALRDLVMVGDGHPVLDAVARDLRAGVPVVSALRRHGDIEGPMRLVCATLAVAIDRGGAAADALSRLRDVLSDTARAEADARAAAAQARASATVVVGLPLVFGVVVAVVDSSVAAVYLGPAGTACAAVALVLDLAGWRWMHHLVAA